MGYTTEFIGSFDVTPSLKPTHAAYLRAFSETRRMNRNAEIAKDFPDPLRKAVGLPIGPSGAYYVGSERKTYGQDHDKSIVDYNSPPASQPGLWCKWQPSEDGSKIEWNEAEKFYDYTEWLNYLITNFLIPWGYQLSGTVEYQGEDHDDFGRITIKDGQAIGYSNNA